VRDRDRQQAKEKVMRELAAIAGASAVLGIVAVSSTVTHAAAESNMATTVEAANPLWRDAALRRRHHRGAARPSHEYTNRGAGAAFGCYRWGETGYHWYNFCLGPSWLYPHERVCRRGYCWYR
jgi:hypothetical protein